MASARLVGMLMSACVFVQIGPVRPRGVSERKEIAPGRYRIFAQGYTANDASLMISLDLGLWSSRCTWNPIGP